MARKPVIVGNWKMHKTADETRAFVEALKRYDLPTDKIDLALCPPFTSLAIIQAGLQNTPIGWGAQNMHWAPEGAYTGEISAKMLLTLGCQYVILGHSERRAFFSEDNTLINQKLGAALAAGLTPILCVGETLQQREAGQTEAVVREQLTTAWAGLSRSEIRRLIIAYEPIWAIGTGKTATSEQANQVHAYLRALLNEGYGEEVGEAVRIQYGGSVKSDNAASLLRQSDIDGALVGGASLQVDSLVAIIQAVLEQAL